jgi:hypothetical protein
MHLSYEVKKSIFELLPSYLNSVDNFPMDFYLDENEQKLVNRVRDVYSWYINNRKLHKKIDDAICEIQKEYGEPEYLLGSREPFMYQINHPFDLPEKVKTRYTKLRKIKDKYTKINYEKSKRYALWVVQNMEKCP